MSNSMTAVDLEISAPGTVLQKAREEAGLSRREVGDSIHMLPRQIEFLEQDDYAQFNGDIFCKGYLKSYAKLLGLDPGPLIAGYLRIRPEIEQKLTVLPHSALPIQHPHKGRSIQYWFLAATAVVVVTLWNYGTNKQFDSQTGESMDQESKVQTVIVDKNTEINPAIVQQKEVLVAATAVEQTALTSLDGDTAEKNLIGEQYVGDQSQGVADADQHDLLSFIFTGDCWVEVKDSSNKVLYANLKRASETLTVNGKAPFSVLLGYAPGVSVNYNGKPIEVNVNRKNNAAKLVIGQL